MQECAWVCKSLLTWKTSLSGIFSVRNIKFAIQESENHQGFVQCHIPWLKYSRKNIFYASAYASLSRSDMSWWMWPQGQPASSDLTKSWLALGFWFTHPEPWKSIMLFCISFNLYECYSFTNNNTIKMIAVIYWAVVRGLCWEMYVYFLMQP